MNDNAQAHELDDLRRRLGELRAAARAYVDAREQAERVLYDSELYRSADRAEDRLRLMLDAEDAAAARMEPGAERDAT